MSRSCIITLLSLLAVLPELELRESKLKTNHSGSKHTSGPKQIYVTEVTSAWTTKPHFEVVKSIADQNSSLQPAHTHYDHRRINKSKHIALNYPDNTESDTSGTKNFHNTLKKGEGIRQEHSQNQKVKMSYFDQSKLSSTKYTDDEENTSQGTIQSYKPRETEDTVTSSKNTHTIHSWSHMFKDNNVDITGLLASTVIKTVGSAQRPTEVINLSCCKISSSTADCTGCELTCVPTDLPRNITRLLLTDNYISSDDLYAGVFVNYTQLVELCLDSNNITFLPEGVFDGLEHLRFLSLYKNKITLNMELNNSTVFYTLNNTLETLILNRNTNDTRNKYLVYPDLALSVLKNLSRLHIDGLTHRDFSIGFSNLTKLTHLSLAGYQDGYCNMISISNHTFGYLEHLAFLNLSDCQLNGSLIDSNAFSKLTKLQVLDVSFNRNLGIGAVSKFMYGLRNNTHFVRLKIANIVARYTPCVVIYRHTLKYFKHTVLKVIEAMNNEIEMIGVGALDMLPSTLEILNLTGNRIMFGAYWKDMASLTGLKQLHLGGSIIPQEFPVFYPSSNVQCHDFHIENYIDHLLVKQKLGEEKCICGPDTCSSNTEELVLPLPPKLQVLTLHSESLAYTVNGIRFCPANNLTSVDLSNNMFKYLRGLVTGLNHIRNLNLTSCSIKTIGDDFFDNLTSLENLDLFENYLGDCINHDLNGEIFDKLISLRHLNLSFNDVHILSRGAFKDLTNLETLDLSRNTIIQINFTIKHMTKLRFLDLHKNDIVFLPKDFRDMVDELLKENSCVKIDMSDNLISCECQNLEFLEWMVVNRNVFGDNYANYYCIYDSGDIINIPVKNGYEDKVKELRRECSPHGSLFFGAVGGTLLLLVSIMGLLVYRFRWTLRYWYHAAKMKIYSSPHQVNEEYEYDVFVSSEDVDFVLQELSPHLSGERHIKLMIHGEKFQAGRHITDNIYMAVHQCRKTLVLVTRQMLASHWCTYELQIARMESISTGRDVLVFLFLEEIPATLISVEVMSYIKTSTYIFYPTNVQHREAFWNKLADDIRAS